MPSEIEQLLAELNGDQASSTQSDPPAPAPAATVEDVDRVVRNAIGQTKAAQDDGATASYDPEMTPEQQVRESIRLEQTMLSEIKAMYPTMPETMLRQVQQEIASLPTLEDLHQNYKVGAHKMLADHFVAEAKRTGKFSDEPARITGGEPAHSFASSVAPGLTNDALKGEIKELEAIFKDVNPDFKFDAGMVQRGLVNQ